MKRIIIILLAIWGSAEAQITYTPMTAAGYQFKYIKIDSGLAVPLRDTVIGRGVIRAGLIVYKPSTGFFGYNGSYWVALGSGGGGGSLQATTDLGNTTITDFGLVTGDTQIGWLYNNGGIGQIDLTDANTDYITTFKPTGAAYVQGANSLTVSPQTSINGTYIQRHQNKAGTLALLSDISDSIPTVTADTLTGQRYDSSILKLYNDTSITVNYGIVNQYQRKKLLIPFNNGLAMRGSILRAFNGLGDSTTIGTVGLNIATSALTANGDYTQDWDNHRLQFNNILEGGFSSEGDFQIITTGGGNINLTSNKEINITSGAGEDMFLTSQQNITFTGNTVFTNNGTPGTGKHPTGTDANGNWTWQTPATVDTSSLSNRINLKANIASPTFTGTVTIPTPFTLGATSVTSTGTQLNYLNAATGTTGTTSTNVVFSTGPTINGLLITSGSAISNATSANRGSFTFGNPGVALSVNIADAATSFRVINSNASATGLIASFESSLSASALTIARSGLIGQYGTATAGGTTGAQTINKPTGTVNFAAAATSLVVTNSLVSTSSAIVCQIMSNDLTMTSTQVVAGSGSFTIYANAAATTETKVYFEVKAIN